MLHNLIAICTIAVVVNSIIRGTNATSDYAGPIITLPDYGELLGKDNGFYSSYESIPYAEPPIGDLRFEPPKPYNQRWSKPFDGRVMSPVCMQWDQVQIMDDKLVGVEDCLTVSVYGPKLANTEDGIAKLPVVVLLHGGAFMFGNVNAYGHEIFMRTGRFIVVKIAYRLGPLGFLSTEDEVIPGNYGLKDQRLALKWIKNNIEHFGGDPENILLIGFSAGGASAHLQMMHKDLGNLVKVVASISGTAFSPWAMMTNARERAFEMANKIGCPTTSTSMEIKACLKEKNAADIVRAVREFLIFGYNPFTTFGPVVEHINTHEAFLTQPVEEKILSGEIAQIPWLASYVAQDGGYNAAELLQITPNGRELIEYYNDNWVTTSPHSLFFSNLTNAEQVEYALKLKQHYLGDKEFTIDAYPDLERMYTDVLFKNGIQQSLSVHQEANTAPVYAYRYDNPADSGYAQLLARRTDLKFGTVHGDDLLLIFSNPIRSPVFREDEQRNSNNFLNMLDTFVNTKVPSFGSCQFEDNIGQEHLQIMIITGTSCESKSLASLP